MQRLILLLVLLVAGCSDGPVRDRRSPFEFAPTNWGVYDGVGSYR